MSTQVFFVRIYLDDHADRKSEDESIGLYNVPRASGDTSGDLAGDAAAGQKDVAVTDASVFSAKTSIEIVEGATSEVCVIDSIAGNTLTMLENLDNSYTAAGGASVHADSEFRWVQNAVPSLSEAWCNGMLVRNGIGKIARIADIRSGGGLAKVTGLEVSVQNTAQFWNNLFNTLDISLIGYRAEVGHFTDTTETILWSGICGKPSWNRTEFTIPLRGKWKRRNANIVTEENVTGKSGKVSVPATFGKWRETPAKFVRSVDDTETKYMAQITGIIDDEYGSDITDVWWTSGGFRKAFPIVAADAEPTLNYQLQLGTSSELSINKDFGALNNPLSSNLYLHILVDNNGNDGTYRRVTAIHYASSTNITVTVEKYYPSDPDAQADGSGAWASLVEIQQKHKGDAWPCADFLDEGGDPVATPKLQTYSGKERVKISAEGTYSSVERQKKNYHQLPDSGYGVDVAADKNALVIRPRIFDGRPDNIVGYVRFDAQNLRRLEDDDLSDWDSSGSGYAKRYPGLYSDAPSAGVNAITSLSDTDFCTDKDGNTFARFELRANSTGKYDHAIALLFDPPQLPSEDFEFEELYIGLKLQHHGSGWGTSSPSFMRFRWQRFLQSEDSTKYVIDETVADEYQPTESDDGGLTLYNLPDEYFINNAPDTDDQYFYHENTAGTNWNRLSGLGQFKVNGITTFDEFQTIEKFGLLFITDMILVGYEYIDIYGLSFLFKQKHPIDEIFSFFEGRVFDDTWGGRVTDTDTILSPVDALEALCRWQDWSEVGAMPSAGWGKAYADFAKIKTGTAFGGFDHADLTELDDYSIATQIRDVGEGWTNDLKDTICREFNLLSSVDPDGSERVTRVPTTEDELDTPTELITFADVRLANSKIEIEEPNPMNVYPEPFVRYNKNPATDEYDSVIRVKNVTAASYDSSYVEAPDNVLTGDEAENLWDRCVELYNLCGIVNEPPRSLTDLRFANGGGDEAHEIAKRRINSWVNWMRLKHVEFEVHFLCTAGGGTAVRQWQEGQRFRLQLPHETDDVAVECIADRIVIDPNPPYHIQIGAYMLETEKLPEDFYIKKTYDANDENWQKTYDATDTNLQKVY